MSEIHSGHRQRMLEKFEKFGFSAFSEHEKLELILFYSVPRRDTNELAHILLNKYKTISALMDASKEDLKKFPYIGDRTYQLFQIIKATSNLYNSEKKQQTTYMNTVDEIATYFQLYFAGVSDEHLALMCLNAKGKFLSCEFIAEGDLDSIGVSVRKIVESVLKNSANMAVLCHNHPSGIALPSRADIYVTRQIKAALESVNVFLKDHIILSNDNDYVSMALSKEYSSIFM